VFQQTAYGPSAGSALRLLEVPSPWPVLPPFLGKIVICAENGEYEEESSDSRESSDMNCHAYIVFFHSSLLDSAVFVENLC
jgi:hypothetical protein